MEQNNSVELADIVRGTICRLTGINSYERKILQNIMDCRTAALGGHLYCCTNDGCDYVEISYNSCRDRNCPKCQGQKRLKWISARLEEVLPVEYFHVVFTIPSILHDIFLYNKEYCFRLLFKAVSKTLLEVALQNRKLGIKPGFISVLHTWTQQLNFHPHIHCIVPGGGITPDKEKWKSCKRGYLLPRKILSCVFRGKLLSYLEKAHAKGELHFSGETDYLNTEENFKLLLKKSTSSDWMVYAKKTFAGPAQVINYLGGYTHRIAISNRRILSFKDGEVTFEWKDRRDNNTTKIMTLDAVLFLKRFILHILPKRFTKIRYYGFMANACKTKSIALCRKLIKISGIETEKIDKDLKKTILSKLNRIKEANRCPLCGKGDLFIAEEVCKLNCVTVSPIRGG